MNEFDKNNSIEKLLQEAAESTNPNYMFVSELEQKLKQKHKPRKVFAFPTIQSMLPTLGRVAILIALAVIMTWFFRSNKPPITAQDPDFICPVTLPNGSLPPGELNADPNYFGNGQIWTRLQPDGIVHRNAGNQDPNDSYFTKWYWWRKANVPLTVEGHRIDEDAEPLIVEIPDGYVDNFQLTMLTFPTFGCWEVTGRAGESSLTFVVNIVFDEDFTPEPEPINVDATPVSTEATPQGQEYKWYDQSVYLNASFPDTPAEMKIYLARNETLATADSAKALASQFGMAGEVYEVPGDLPDTKSYAVVDGNKYLEVRSNTYFNYYPDYTRSVNAVYVSEQPNAEALIQTFMQTYGFDFEYKVEKSEFQGGYTATFLSPDGFPMRNEYFTTGGLSFYFNGTDIARVDASLPAYDEISTASIISAEEAFQMFLDPNTIYGMTMSMHSPSTSLETWIRPRAFNTGEVIPYYGYMTSTGRSIDGADPQIFLDGYPVSGNISGISENMQFVYVEANGRFIEKDGVKSFEIQTWKISDGYEESYEGTIERQGNQVVMITSDGNTLILPDVPESLPLPAENMFILGVTRGDVFEWKSIDNRNMSGGGGGGGGSVFYKLNLSGTPIPFPTTPAIADATPVPAEPVVIDGWRGTLSITISKTKDGSQQTQYALLTQDENGYDTFFILEGDNLDALLDSQMQPIKVWGVTDVVEGPPTIRVERYEILFPDLEFQILKGTQKLTNLNGQDVVIFTTEAGQSFVQLDPNGEINISTNGAESDPVLLEALTIPDEFVDGYPTVRVFSSAMAINPKNNEPIELTITSNQPYTTEEMTDTQGLILSLTIEKIELVYFTPDRRYGVPLPNAEPPYLQPVWRFNGHYSDGSEFEILVQALKKEFLSPEVEQAKPLG